MPGGGGRPPVASRFVRSYARRMMLAAVGLAAIVVAAAAPVQFVTAPSPAPSVSPSPPPDAKTLADLAIKARGGEEALRNATVLAWRARGVLHGEERPIPIEGRWIVEPPDRAVVATWETGKGPSTTRRLVLLGSQGFLERDGARTPMAPEVLAGERDRFYLYSLMLALPLRDPGTRLTATGPRTLRVERDGRPAVDLFFDRTGWLDRLRAEWRDPAAGTATVEEWTFAGEVGAKGVRWPRRVNVSRDGAPVVDLEILELGIGTAAQLEREASPK